MACSDLRFRWFGLAGVVLAVVVEAGTGVTTAEVEVLLLVEATGALCAAASLDLPLLTAPSTLLWALVGDVFLRFAPFSSSSTAALPLVPVIFVGDAALLLLL